MQEKRPSIGGASGQRKSSPLMSRESTPIPNSKTKGESRSYLSMKRLGNNPSRPAQIIVMLFSVRLVSLRRRRHPPVVHQTRGMIEHQGPRPSPSCSTHAVSQRTPRNKQTHGFFADQTYAAVVDSAFPSLHRRATTRSSRLCTAGGS